MGPPPIETTPSWDEQKRSRIDRFLCPQEGGGDIFGSEKSYSLPVGTNFDLDAKQPGGYYIDSSQTMVSTDCRRDFASAIRIAIRGRSITR